MNYFKMELQWYPVRPYKEIPICEGISGIYIWGFGNSKNFTPYYVGKSENIGWRLSEHMANILGGNYTIFSKQQFKFFDKNSDPKYSPKTIKDKLDFLRLRNTKLKPHIDYLVNSFSFTYAEVLNFKQFGRRAEINTIESIGKSRLINSRGGTISQEIGTGDLETILNISLHHNQ